MIGLILALIALPALAQTRDENATRCTSDDPDISIGGCNALIQSGRKLPQGLAATYDYRGSAYAGKHLYDQAITDFTQAITLSPDLPYSYMNRGSTYDDMGQRDQAIADFNKAIALKPNLAEAYANRGLTFEKMGQRDAAIADYRHALKLKPSTTGSSYQDGAVRFRALVELN